MTEMNGTDYIPLRRRARLAVADDARVTAFLTSRGLSSADAAMAVEIGRNLLRLPDQRISVAGVVEYLGSQVGSAEQLDPKRTYRLLRPPEVLERAAETAVFEVPLVDGHPPFDTDTADDAELAEFRIGNLRKVTFDGFYLRAAMITVTSGRAIASILNGTKTAWSIAYHRGAIMEPGTWKGEQYDGVLRDIELTHVGLVDASRAGAATRISFPNGENS